jgi:hypothetical protein
MQRELFVVQSLMRLGELLGGPSVGSDGVLGVGVFAAVPAAEGGSGVVLRVSPKSLRSQILCTVGAGFLAPVSGEILFLGDSRVQLLGGRQATTVSPVSRWLLMGLHSVRLSTPGLWDSYEQLFPDLASAQSCGEIIAVFLRAVHGRLLDLRPDRVVLMPDFDLMSSFVQAVFQVKQQSGVDFASVRREVVEAVLSWCVEELLHPWTVLCLENSSDFSVACSTLHQLRRSVGGTCEVTLRL